MDTICFLRLILHYIGRRYLVERDYVEYFMSKKWVTRATITAKIAQSVRLSNRSLYFTLKIENVRLTKKYNDHIVGSYHVVELFR